MPKLPFNHPKTPPEWLSSWPAEDNIRGMFSEGIRSYCYRVLEQERVEELHWTAEVLVLRLGHQQATWRLAGDQWTRKCTCGYVNDRCVHLYAAARIFLEVANAKEWLGRPPRKPRAAAGPVGKVRRRSPEPARASTESDDVGRRLEVEVDFLHEPGKATIRFYLNENDRRQMLRLQRVLNLALHERGDDVARDSWSSVDRRLLRWLGPQLRGQAAVQQGLRVLKLPRERFEYWLEYWSDCPGRFIERATQKPLSVDGNAARMVIGITDQGDWVGIDALIVTPAGKQYHVHEVFGMLAAGQREVVLDGDMLAFAPALTWDTIEEFFSRKSQRMRRKDVCEFLPVLIENRLDIIEGPLVRHETGEGDVRICASADGADILLKATVGRAVIHPGTSVAAGHIREVGREFVVTVFESPFVGPVRRFLRALDLVPEGGGTLRLAGTVEKVTGLVEGWAGLPEAVEKVCDPALASLLGAAAQMTPELSLQDQRNFVQLRVAWSCGDQHLSDAEVQDAVRSRSQVVRTQQGGWLRIDPDAVVRLREQVRDLGLGENAEQRFFRPDARRTLQKLNDELGASVSARSRSLAERLLAEPEPELPSLTAELAAVLRSYQKQGVDFLLDRCLHGVGAILADDMGLGKTLQVLAALTGLMQRPGGKQSRDGGVLGALVVCPASVVAVWLDEAARFCPALRCVPYVGSPEERPALLQRADWDVLVANYALVRNDAEQFAAVEFDYVILDEAQQIKNPNAQIAQIVKQLRTSHALALTGTPLENRLLDLWSIVDFVNPEFLGSQETFCLEYEQLQRRSELAHRIAPVMLRRTKQAVAPELPPRTEELLKVEMGEEQRLLYDTELLRAREIVRDRGPIEILAALTRLRQICCHPTLLLKEPNEIGSAKLDAMMQMVEEILDEGHSALIFSQFTSMIALLEDALGETPSFTITGQTPTKDRARLVKQFSESEDPRVFLLSLRAAGTGLTLTKADYVFIFDPWWNPAVERQAIDRTHRIGQDKPVIAYRLVAADTVEERVLALQREKAELFADVMADAEREPLPQRLTAADLELLLQ